MKKPFQILLVPSSDDEPAYENTGRFATAVRIHKKRRDSARVFSFSTSEEREAFAKGVEAMAGYMGDGMTFSNVPSVKPKNHI